MQNCNTMDQIFEYMEISINGFMFLAILARYY